MKKKNGGRGGFGLGGQGGCERRIEVFVKIQKKKILWGGRSEGGSGGGVGLGGGVRMDVNEELKFLSKFNFFFFFIFFFFGGGGGRIFTKTSILRPQPS